MVLAYILGMQERRRLGKLTVGDLNDGFVNDGLMEGIALIGDTDTHNESARPNLLWINASLTLALMVALVSELLPIAVLFMLGFAIALLINYPKMEEQRRRVASHAGNVVAVVSIIFAAGIFTGILNGTGMVEAMSRGFLAAIPESWGPYLAPITALVSMPFTFFMSNDAFYFGALPIISEAAGHYGIAPAEMARASLVGQPVHLLSPLVPSTYLLVGLAGVEFGDHQRFTIRWAVLICLLIGASAMLCSAFPMTA
jgi:citrate-Mg2+:H+ or citrate-Ca2+:H+ symporter, CitMHS family